MSQPKILEKHLKTAQIGSAVAFLPFLVTHLINAVLGVLGPTSYKQFQKAAQQIYQIPIVELLFVLIPLLVHMLAGLALLLINRRQTQRLSARRRFHRWAGLFLALVILGHVIATRGLPWANGFHAEFAGVAFSLWWIPWYFYPYYFLLFMAGTYHAAHGSSALAQRLFGIRILSGKGQMQVLVFSAALLITLTLLSFGGILRDNPDPKDNDFARLYQELFNLEFYQ